jgi:uncharacterized protein
MWEFRNRNVFGATAFSTYGGFWIGVGLWLHFIAGPVAATAGVAVDRDLAWILLAFAIFNTYMLIVATQVNTAVFLVFLTLEATEIFLFAGLFTTKTAILPPHTAGLVRVGGYVGVLTALVAWYTSAAGVMNGHKGRRIFPVGRPFGSVAAASPEPAARA